jgi:hypothetical protein
VQHLGRNMHYLLTREALTRRPRLLVIEVQEEEPRAQHPAFHRIADLADILFAPLILNTSYFSDLGRLPIRRVALLARSVTPFLFDGDVRPNARSYSVPQWNDTYIEIGVSKQLDGEVRPRLYAPSPEELERQRAAMQRRSRAKLALPQSLRWLETRVSLHYLSESLALARDLGVPVRFLYLPSYDGPVLPEQTEFYEARAPLWCMPRLRNEWWNDVAHVNRMGAVAISTWLGRKIAEEMPRTMRAEMRAD